MTNSYIRAVAARLAMDVWRERRVVWPWSRWKRWRDDIEDLGRLANVCWHSDGEGCDMVFFAN